MGYCYERLLPEALAAGLVWWLSVAAAVASTFTVQSSDDLPDASLGDGLCQALSGSCTLRAAVTESNASPGADTIEVLAGTYFLTLPTADPFERVDSEGDMGVTDHVVIRGAGAGATIVDASALGDKVFEVRGSRFNSDPLQVEINGLTLTGGTTPLVGGCIYHIGNGAMTLRETVVAGCSASTFAGGGIFHEGSGLVGQVVLIDSVVSDNRANFGGGIDNSNGDLTLIRTGSLPACEIKAGVYV